MSYKVVLKEEADNDLSELSHNQKILIFKQFKKLENSPELGLPLGKKAGYDLTEYRKMYADKKKLRIVYRIIDDIIVVEIIAIGKRDDMDVYQKASERI
ncbi:type II toxin-antitoxin system RelE/ParE family toxin [bacterium]|nr:type II toxin-antitoxin system RelE/ParE family toxin [bacterium]MBU1958794.1 type II toxin-antitoxin system RelE/ParE family toxin [bacterium]